MPRNGADVFSMVPGTQAVSGQTIDSSDYNARMADFESDANTPRPEVAGGTGEDNFADALVAMGAQPVDADTTAIAALGWSARCMLVKTAASTYALVPSLAYGESLLNTVDAPALRTLAGLGTAAVKNTGTSGDAVPLLNGASAQWSSATPDKRIYETDGPTNEKYWWEYIDAGIYSFRLVNDAFNADLVIYNIDRTGHTAAVVNFNPSGGITLQYGGSAVLTAADAGTSGTKLSYLDGANTWSAQQTYSVGLTLNNNIVLKGKETGGTARELVQMNTSNAVQVGDANNGLALKGSAITYNNVAVPTISSSDSLSNKTLPSPTFSGTLAGSPAVSGLWTFGNTLTVAATNARSRVTGGAGLADTLELAVDAGAAYLHTTTNTPLNFRTNSTLALTVTAGQDLVGTSVGPTSVYSLGYKGVPVARSATASATLALTDAGSQIRVAMSAGSQTVTIPPNSSVAFPIGTSIEISATGSSNTFTVVEGSGVTLTRGDGTAGTGTRTVTSYSKIVLQKDDTNDWSITGAFT